MNEREKRAVEFASGVMTELAGEYGTTGDFGEGSRQWNVLYEGGLEAQQILADVELEIERILDQLEQKHGALDREAVKALANIYCERGSIPHAALEKAAEQMTVPV